jgi:hypothetical protein
VLYCKVGCKPEAIVAELGMTLADLFHDDDELVENELFEIDKDSAAGDQPSSGSAGNGEPVSIPESKVAEPAPVPKATEPAGADQLDRVYGKLVAELTLCDEHRADLRRRGLADDGIDRRGYRTLRKFPVRQAVGRLKKEFEEATLLRVPGFRSRNGRLQFSDREGLLVPVRDLAGRIIALKVRADGGQAGAKYTWVSSADQGGPSPGSPPHVPLGTQAQAEAVRLTEGELKADIAFTLSGLPTVGISGVDQWKSALPVLQAMGAKVVHVAFDMDAQTKPGVAAALAACVRELIRLKYEVRLETWNPDDGKGVDDLLAAGKQPTVVTGRRSSPGSRRWAGRPRISPRRTSRTAGSRGIRPRSSPGAPSIASTRTCRSSPRWAPSRCNARLTSWSWPC